MGVGVGGGGGGSGLVGQLSDKIDLYIMSLALRYCSE